MKHHRAGDGERILAVFIDFENLALGFGGRRDRFQIEKVLERLVEKGKIVAKKAYADWSRFGGYAGSLHEAAIELIEIPKRSLTGKNSADIRLVVDAIDLAYSKDHIDTFVVVSGDSDFSPLVSKLKELGKHVIGLGLVEATSNLLRDNCDEFIYYEDLDRPAIAPLSENAMLPEAKRKVFALLLDSLVALRRENKDQIFSSMVKDTMKRKKPSFNEEYHGYRTFSDLLEDAQRYSLIEIEKHKTSGTYVVIRFGGEIRSPIATMLPTAPPLAIHGSRGRQPEPPRQLEATPRQLEVPPRHLEVPPRQLEAPPRQPQGRPAGPAEYDRREDDHPPLRGPQIARPPLTLPPPVQPQQFRPATPAPPPPPVRPPVQPQPQSAPAARQSRPQDDDDEDDEDTPKLGRSLIDDVDTFDDDLDEVPSYAPGGSAARTPTRPGTAASKPTTAPAKKVVPKPKAPAAEPRKVVAVPKLAAEPVKKVTRPAAPVAAVVPPPPPPPPPPPVVAPKPPPVKKPVVEEDSFGAGLDD